ncbi:uncharacterized protein MYCFIDRAFT_199298 [Pseudocercospora fijiensis CIRAD86]|uniref:YDG domain-containing protein n=1 Tax=Pseudocercospora fijiensis (strain CIRAD86) TaxID=383855 RepID=M3AR56_PSEFD|nr:uncharacterized protein MYCFIDRAFT_199298 [Pseudocercospora fijiensis CIRAD86]EME79578.1 hypothetical protein MYCFIDRAFT_199298 [Pseudocercospora fijiensis CIRAD86]
MSIFAGVKLPAEPDFDIDPWLQLIKDRLIPALATPEQHGSEYERILAEVNDFLYDCNEYEPELVEECQEITACLFQILDYGDHIPANYVQEASRLLEKHEVEHRDMVERQQEQDEEEEQEDESNEDIELATPVIDDKGEWCYPPATDAIWGDSGRLRGLALRKSKKGKWVPVVDQNYKNEQRNAFKQGHDHLAITPGDVFFYQMQAFFHGGHGETQSNFAFHEQKSMVGVDGVYSLIMSNSADFWTFNEDEGSVIWYSPEYKKHKANGQPLDVSVTRAVALGKTLDKKGVIRIFRAYGCSEHFPDSENSKKYNGLLRYEGLYCISEKREQTRQIPLNLSTNGQGPQIRQVDHKYYQYRLERMPDAMNKNVSFDQVKQHPTQEELRDFRKARKREFLQK